ncbi:MAG: hypothetical protein IT370_09940 [Deltaproteobacteria bacterium]|nr:hypothetical protein [Deltaproteobacteria bacterium]
MGLGDEAPWPLPALVERVVAATDPGRGSFSVGVEVVVGGAVVVHAVRGLRLRGSDRAAAVKRTLEKALELELTERQVVEGEAERHVLEGGPLELEVRGGLKGGVGVALDVLYRRPVLVHDWRLPALTRLVPPLGDSELPDALRALLCERALSAATRSGGAYGGLTVVVAAAGDTAVAALVAELLAAAAGDGCEAWDGEGLRRARSDGHHGYLWWKPVDTGLLVSWQSSD